MFAYIYFPSHLFESPFALCSFTYSSFLMSRMLDCLIPTPLRSVVFSQIVFTLHLQFLNKAVSHPVIADDNTNFHGFINCIRTRSCNIHSCSTTSLVCPWKQDGTIRKHCPCRWISMHQNRLLSKNPPLPPIPDIPGVLV